MTLEHPRHLDHRPQLASHGPRIPSLEEAIGTRRIDMPPEPAEQIGDSPGSRRLQAVLLNRVEAATLLGREVRLVGEPELTGALEPVVVLGLKGLVFSPSHLIDGFPEMLGDMELVVNTLGVRRLRGHCLGIRGKHVGSDGTHLLPLLDGERREDASSGHLRTFRSDIEDTGAVEIGEDGNVVLASPEALLVDADALDGRGLATLEAACHGAVHDRLRCIPGEPEQRSRRFHRTASLKNFDREVLEEEREARVLPGPWRHDGFDTVLRAPAPGEAGDKLRRELHRVQVSPAPLVRVIGEAAGHSALGADHARTDVGKADLDAPILDLEVNRLHPPGVIEAKQTGVMRLKCVHFGTLPNRRPSMNRPRRATEIPEEPIPESFNLDGTPPTCTVEAASSKRRKRDVQPLPDAIVPLIRSWLASQTPRRPIFKSIAGDTARMLRSDLAAARQAWIGEAKQDEAETVRRQESDFLAYRDQHGRVADFHSLRVVFISRVVAGGASVREAQTLPPIRPRLSP